MKRRRASDILRDEPTRRPARAKGTATFYRWLNPPPTLPDRDRALAYLAEVRNVLERDLTLPAGDPEKLTRAARSGLQRIERKWAKRATGQDPRWNAVGTRPGRVSKEIEGTIRRPDPAWK